MKENNEEKKEKKDLTDWTPPSEGAESNGHSVLIFPFYFFLAIFFILLILFHSITFYKENKKIKKIPSKSTSIRCC